MTVGLATKEEPEYDIHQGGEERLGRPWPAFGLERRNLRARILGKILNIC
jgi:hypothetical protein